jgi:hypothetical protein
VDEEAAPDSRAYFEGLPGYRFVGSYGSYSAAMSAARRLCAGRTMY